MSLRTPYKSNMYRAHISFRLTYQQFSKLERKAQLDNTTKADVLRGIIDTIKEKEQ